MKAEKTETNLWTGVQKALAISFLGKWNESQITTLLHSETIYLPIKPRMRPENDN